MIEYFVSFGEKHRLDYVVIEQEVSNMQTALWFASEKEMHQAFVKGVNAFCHFLNVRGLYAQEESYLKQAQTLATSLDDKGGLAGVLLNLGRVAIHRGDYEQAGVNLQEGLDLASQLRHREYITDLLVNLGALASDLGNDEQVEVNLQEGVDLARQLGFRLLTVAILDSRSELGPIQTLVTPGAR